MGIAAAGKIALGSLAALLLAGMLALVASSCGTPTPFLVSGPGQSGNDPPTLTFLEPTENITRGQGDPFLIRWTDSDSDDNASIDFWLIGEETNTNISLVQGIDENDLTGPDSFTVDTALVPVGTYHLLGTIDDGTNPTVNVFASTVGAATRQRVVVTIVGEGEGPQTVPPVITVTEPQFNLSVAQEDTIRIVVQPMQAAPNQALPYDPDSEVTIFLLLDLDQDPNNDDPSSPDPSQIILLEQRSIAAGAFEAIEFNVRIELSEVPPRPGGEPYFIRVTVDDGTNPRVHRYAVGTISVVQLPAGLVDLFDIGRSKAGARFQGFSPSANVGSTVNGVSDFDGDGVADFVIVAQFGNPRNVGPVGEAYLIYGRNNTRFGGVIPVNSISETVSGVIFEAPPVRVGRLPTASPRSDGITDVGFIRDLTGDQRPELLFGLPHVHGAFEAMDFDPADEDITTTDDTVEIEVVLRQGRATVQNGQDDPVVTSLIYSGVEDLTISSAAPGFNSGSATDLSWRDAGASEREWILIKFKNILAELPDTANTIDISSISATLELRVFGTGGPATVHWTLSDFDEQTTYNTFAQNGGDPIPDVDYILDQALLGGNLSFDGGTAGTQTVDISTIVTALIDGQLAFDNNELHFIMVAGTAEAANRTSVRSSEYSQIQTDRPKLRIGYTRLSFQGSFGCYPDRLVNNRTDTGTQDRFDTQLTAGGLAIIVNSENRDSSPRLSPEPLRLETTSVALELVGQEPFILDADGLSSNDTGSIFVRADDIAELGRIAGARFMAGPFDFEDHLLLNQPPRDGLFGQTVSSIGDLNNDGLDEILISAPNNERHVQDLFDTFGFQSTHWASSVYRGSIIVIPGTNYNASIWREEQDGSSSIPFLDQQIHGPFGRCTNPPEFRHLDIPADSFQVFAETIDDRLGGARSAGDFNQDGIDDLLCGAYLNNRPGVVDSGATYILYGRNILGDFQLRHANDPVLRAPMLRVRGVRRGDQIGWRQATGLDVNGDRKADVFLSSPRADFGGVTRSTCAGDFNGDGTISSGDLVLSAFNSCRTNPGDDVFSDDVCKVFDYDNDLDIDDDDRCVFCCLSDECSPSEDCVFGTGDDCCANLVDNGFVGIIFGGVFTDGDRDISQIATSDLPGTVFFGSAAGHRAGVDISSAGDFNQDGFGDLLIAVPGETRLDDAGRERLGVVYLVFGGTHLVNTKWSLASVGSVELPGIVFLSPFVKGRPNEAAPTTVAFIGDINADGFGDIAIGNPRADFIDQSFPQGPDAPGTDAEVGRRRNAGDAYIIYGNNFGSNRSRR